MARPLPACLDPQVNALLLKSKTRWLNTAEVYTVINHVLSGAAQGVGGWVPSARGPERVPAGELRPDHMANARVQHRIRLDAWDWSCRDGGPVVRGVKCLLGKMSFRMCTVYAFFFQLSCIP